jgi:hypothetical protein
MVLLCLVVAAVLPAAAQQRADPHFRYAIEHPAFPGGDGPVVAIDAGHNNFHTADGRFAPFAALAREDGFRVVSIEGPIDAKAIADIDILVIANARLPSELQSLSLTSAFFQREIAEIHDWLERGGSLLLIADHAPFAGAAYDLAASFGFEFTNGYAVDASSGSMGFTFLRGRGLDLTSVGDQGLAPIERVMTFTGQAIKIPSGASSILTLAGNYVSMIPTIPGRLDETAKIVDVSGYSQGAVMKVGQGKIAVFGEAGAFTAQISVRGKAFGMNAPGAEENAPFVLTILRWLALPSD